MILKVIWKINYWQKVMNKANQKPYTFAIRTNRRLTKNCKCVCLSNAQKKMKLVANLKEKKDSCRKTYILKRGLADENEDRERAHVCYCRIDGILCNAEYSEVGYTIYLPPGYAKNSQKRYPVIYMHDGQMHIKNHIDVVPDNIIYRKRIPEVIVVMINDIPSPLGRTMEFIPWDGKWKEKPEWLEWIRSIPHIQAEY